MHVPDVIDGLEIATELRFQIVEAFEREGIAIPFPQRDVNLKLSDIEALADAIDNVNRKKARKAAAKT